MSETLEIQPEQVYIYQPTDENDMPIGGKQVIKYTTNEELTQKLVEQNTLLIRKLRKETRNNRLGIQEKENLPDDVQKFTGFIEFKPRDLSDDERVDISRRLLDPTTSLEAMDQLLEARIGAPINTLGKTITDVQNDNMRLRAKQESDAFMASTPGYFKCAENAEALTSWMLRYNLAPVKDNFQKAYDTLKQLGVLIEGPKVEPEPVVIPVPIVEPVRVEIPVEPVVVVPPVTTVPGISSGLTRDDSSESGPTYVAGNDIVYEATIGGRIEKINGVETLVGASKKVFTGRAALDAMPSDEYKKRLLHEKGFQQKVQELDNIPVPSRGPRR